MMVCMGRDRRLGSRVEVLALDGEGITATLLDVSLERRVQLKADLLVCSVGVAFAFMGTLLAAASAQGTGLGPSEILLWTNLRANASALNPMLIKAAFIFMLAASKLDYILMNTSRRSNLNALRMSQSLLGNKVFTWQEIGDNVT